MNTCKELRRVFDVWIPRGKGCGMNWEMEIGIYIYTIDTMYKIDN